MSEVNYYSLNKEFDIICSSIYITCMKSISMFFLVAFCACSLQAQWQLQFCQSDSNNSCLGKSDLFIWNGENTVVFALIKSENGFSAGKLQFKVFDMHNDLTGDIYAEVKANVKEGSKQVFKKIYFVRPGYYRVEVYDEKINRLAVEYITITDRLE